jgi:hypothetical protein
MNRRYRPNPNILHKIVSIKTKCANVEECGDNITASRSSRTTETSKKKTKQVKLNHDNVFENKAKSTQTENIQVHASLYP